MAGRRRSLSERVRRRWWRWKGEQPLLVVFWPRDYKQGQVYQIDGHFYHITRYLHADDYRFYEVWGYEVESQG
jgi:hypothetical protein